MRTLLQVGTQPSEQESGREFGPQPGAVNWPGPRARTRVTATTARSRRILRCCMFHLLDDFGVLAADCCILYCQSPTNSASHAAFNQRLKLAGILSLVARQSQSHYYVMSALRSFDLIALKLQVVADER